jgi:hypothetical protein
MTAGALTSDLRYPEIYALYQMVKHAAARRGLARAAVIKLSSNGSNFDPADP